MICVVQLYTYFIRIQMNSIWLELSHMDWGDQNKEVHKPINSNWFVASKGYDKRDIIISTTHRQLSTQVYIYIFNNCFLLSHVIPGRIETSPRTSKNFFVWSSYRTCYFANDVFFYGLTYGNSSTLVVKHSNGRSGRVIGLAVMIFQPHSYQKKIKKNMEKGPKRDQCYFRN